MTLQEISKSDIIAIDDNKSELRIMELLFRKLLPNINIRYENHAYSLFPRLSIAQPKILILDYCLKGFNLGDDETIISLLKKYDGKIIVYSSAQKKVIDKKLKDLDYIYISKGNFNNLLNKVREILNA